MSMKLVTKEQEDLLLNQLQKIQRCMPLLTPNQYDDISNTLSQFIDKANLNRDDIV